MESIELPECNSQVVLIHDREMGSDEVVEMVWSHFLPVSVNYILQVRESFSLHSLDSCDRGDVEHNPRSAQCYSVDAW